MKVIVKYLVLLVGFLFCSALKAQSFKADFMSVNYGAVKEWKNDTTWFFITNSSNAAWFILPTFYHQEFQVIAPKGKVFPGQKIKVGVSYYTENSGKFELDIPVYISSEMKAIPFKIKGKILTFHPDAMVYCPTLDPKEPRVMEDFLVVEEKMEEKEKEVEKEKEEESFQEVRDTMVVKDVVIEEEEVLVDTVPEVVLVEEEILEEDKDTVTVIKEDEVVENEDTIKYSTNRVNEVTLSQEYAINNIVFLIDVSGSMKFDNKMKQLKSSLHSLVDVLRPEDRVAIVVYSSRARVLYNPSANADKAELHAQIDSLVADGSSYGKEGLDMAYSLAKKHFVEGGNNSVILATDGMFNSKSFSENKLFRQAAFQAAKKIRLSSLGFGRDKEALKFLRKLTRFGRGRYVKVQKGENNKNLIVDLVKSLSKKSEK